MKRLLILAALTFSCGTPPQEPMPPPDLSPCAWGGDNQRALEPAVTTSGSLIGQTMSLPKDLCFSVVATSKAGSVATVKIQCQQGLGWVDVALAVNPDSLGNQLQLPIGLCSEARYVVDNYAAGELEITPVIGDPWSAPKSEKF